MRLCFREGECQEVRTEGLSCLVPPLGGAKITAFSPLNYASCDFAMFLFVSIF